MPRYELTLEVRGRVRVEIEAASVADAELRAVSDRPAAEILGDPGCMLAEVYVEHVRTLEGVGANGTRR